MGRSHSLTLLFSYHAALSENGENERKEREIEKSKRESDSKETGLWRGRNTELDTSRRERKGSRLHRGSVHVGFLLFFTLSPYLCHISSFILPPSFIRWTTWNRRRNGLSSKTPRHSARTKRSSPSLVGCTASHYILTRTLAPTRHASTAFTSAASPAR